MRYALMVGTLLLSACDVGDAVTEVTAGVVGTTIDVSKGVARGFETGVEEGRKDGRSVDDSTVLSTADEVAATTRLWVVEVAPAGEHEVDVVLGVENLTDTPVHLIGLANDGGALLVDADGFATKLSAPTGAIEAPAKARVKATLRFAGDAERAAAVRVWGQELPVPDAG